MSNTASLEEIANANFIATTNLANQNAVSNQQHFNTLAQSILSKAINMVANTDPVDARCVERILGNPLTEKAQDQNIIRAESR